MLVLERAGKLLVCDKGALPYVPGPYALPAAVLKKGDSPEDTARKLARRILGISTRIGSETRINHAITYRRLVAHAFYAKIGPRRKNLPAPPDHKWIARSELDRFITSALYRKALAA